MHAHCNARSADVIFFIRTIEGKNGRCAPMSRASAEEELQNLSEHLLSKSMRFPRQLTSIENRPALELTICVSIIPQILNEDAVRRDLNQRHECTYVLFTCKQLFR